MATLLLLIDAAGRAFAAFAGAMLLQSGILIGVVFLLDLVLRKRVRAAFRHALWLLVLVKLVLPPSLGLPTGAAWWGGGLLPGVAAAAAPAAGPAAPAAPGAASVLPPAPATAAALPEAESPGPETPGGGARRPVLGWPALLLLLWLTGAGALSALLLRRRRECRRRIALALPPAPELAAHFARLARQAGLRRPPALRLLAAGGVPFACGLGRPTILLPAELARELDETRLGALLLHELLHVKRYDLWVNAGQSVLQVLYHFHPLFWLANAALRRVREEAVDDQVLAWSGKESAVYPETLLAVARRLAGRPSPHSVLVGVAERASHLRRRIQRLLASPVRSSANLGLGGRAAVLLAALVLLPMGPAPGGQEPASQAADAAKVLARRLLIMPPAEAGGVLEALLPGKEALVVRVLLALEPGAANRILEAAAPKALALLEGLAAPGGAAAKARLAEELGLEWPMAMAILARLPAASLSLHLNRMVAGHLDEEQWALKLLAEMPPRLAAGAFLAWLDRNDDRALRTLRALGAAHVGRILGEMDEGAAERVFVLLAQRFQDRGEGKPVPAAEPGPGPAGSGAVPGAVADALDWLVRHQDPSGFWDGDRFDTRCSGDKCSGPASPVHDVGLTGLALLALLGDGNDLRQGRWSGQVKTAVDWLMKRQGEEGLIGERAGQAFMYSHLIATLALAEACGRARYHVLVPKVQAALKYISMARNPYKAWRYFPRDGDNDSSVTSWAVFTLTKARSYRDLGLRVEPEDLKGAIAWFDEMTDPGTGRVGYITRGSAPARPSELMLRFPAARSEAITAAALHARQLAGQDPAQVPILARHAGLLLAKPPAWSASAGAIDMYYWFHGTLALKRLGGPAWEAWRNAVLAAVLPRQRRDGCAKGSWDPVGVWGHEGGRIYATALLAMTLEQCGVAPTNRK